jgi:hypothetical protein
MIFRNAKPFELPVWPAVLGFCSFPEEFWIPLLQLVCPSGFEVQRALEVVFQ